ncbi:MAG TPA: YXWGXW repeat-containing protein [Kofleriaceae bacterium]|jgi:hypothetical protein
MRIALVLVVAACSSDLRYQTQVFAAPQACAQGPFEVDVAADGTTAVDGIELVACTPRRLVGHAEIWIGSTAEMSTFGDTADNARCVGGGGGAVVVAAAGSGSATSSAGGASAGSATKPVLVEQTFRGSAGDDEAAICAGYGGSAQEIADYHVTRTSAEPRVHHGDAMTVRLWSVEPNDLDGVVFLIRHVTSTKPPKQLSKDEVAKLERDRAAENARIAKQAVASPSPRSTPQPTDTPWQAPPPPLAEARPDQPSAAATWVPGYWKWTGTSYGWVAGQWRDASIADMPAQRIEAPGDAPRDAIWIAGAWHRSGGRWVWIGGRWRAR